MLNEEKSRFLSGERQFSTLLGIILITGLTLTTGCRKFVDQNILASSNNSVATNVFDDVFKQVDDAASSETDLNKTEESSWTMNTSACATVTLDPLGATFPKTLTLDFGGGCTGLDGIHRSGKITAVFTGLYRDAGTEISVTLEDYNVAQYAVEGSKSITNGGLDANGNIFFNIDVNDVMISWDDNEITWESTQVRTWTEGSETNFFTLDTAGNFMGWAGIIDDVYEITGTANGTDRNGHPYTVQTTTPLVVQVGCRYIKSGILVISPENYNEGTVDYGNGTCDNQATIEINGQVYNFTM